MTKRASESPSDGRANDTVELDREEAWDRLIDGARALRDASRQVDDRVKAMEQENAELREKLEAGGAREDDPYLAQIPVLESRIEHLESKLERAATEQALLVSTEQQAREALEQAWKEATEQREALAVARTEANQKLEALERQQEESIASLVDGYDEELATARKEIDELRSKRVNEALLKQAQAERDEALQAVAEVRRELEAAVAESEKVAVLEKELEARRAAGGDELRREVERLQVELDEARAGVDQLLADCDRLNAENVRLSQAMRDLEVARPSIPLDLSDSDGTLDAVGMLEAREDDAHRRQSTKPPPAKRPVRASTRRARAKTPSVQPPPEPSRPAGRTAEEKDEGRRTAGSYSLIGGEFATETLSGKKRGPV